LHGHYVFLASIKACILASSAASSSAEQITSELAGVAGTGFVTGGTIVGAGAAGAAGTVTEGVTGSTMDRASGNADVQDTGLPVVLELDTGAGAGVGAAALRWAIKRSWSCLSSAFESSVSGIAPPTC